MAQKAYYAEIFFQKSRNIEHFVNKVFFNLSRMKSLKKGRNSDQCTEGMVIKYRHFRVTVPYRYTFSRKFRKILDDCTLKAFF